MSSKAIFLLSGDHDGLKNLVGVGMTISRGGVRPSCAATYSLYSPLLSLKYETNFPSGDHAGWISAEPLDLVRLRTSPFSAGMVKISPRASTAARLPVDDRAMLVMLLERSFHCGIIHGK